MVAKKKIKEKQGVFESIRRNSTPQYIRRKTIEHMEILGVYKPEFDILVGVFADTVRQYNLAIVQFEKEKYQYEVITGAGGSKKSGTASALEALRKDIGTLTDRLMLNPKSDMGEKKINQTTQNMNTEDLLDYLDEKLSP